MDLNAYYQQCLDACRKAQESREQRDVDAAARLMDQPEFDAISPNQAKRLANEYNRAFFATGALSP